MPAPTHATPRVSVIIPVFNNAPGLRECLSRLRAQDGFAGAFEVIVVDNGSRPELAIPEAYPFLVVLKQCAAPGSYAARNAGVRAANGSIFAFIDSDCRPREDWLVKGVNALAAADACGIVGGDVAISSPVPRTGTGLYQYLLGSQQAENVRDRCFSATANLFCTRQAFDTVGPFNEQLLSGGDREWGWRARRAGVGMNYEPRAVVDTRPRTSLRAAIRQTRRIAAGQVAIRRHGLDHAGREVMTRYRPTRAVPGWILSRSELSWWERVKVLSAAVAIKVAMMFEMRRIRFGGKPERR